MSRNRYLTHAEKSVAQLGDLSKKTEIREKLHTDGTAPTRERNGVAKGEQTSKAALIDYSANSLSRHFACDARLRSGAIFISRCVFKPNPGLRIGAAQFTVALHHGPPISVEWKVEPEDRMQRRTVHNGDIFINCAHRPLYMRWPATLPLTVIAIEDTFVANTLQKEFDGAAFDFSPLIGINDAVIRRLVEAADAQIDSEPAAGRLFADSVATALLVRIFEKYNRHRIPQRALGGLTPRRLTRIINYIENSLGRNLENPALAEVIGLSAHHFAECFTRSMGIPPHQYVTQRRIQKAKELLLNAKLTTAEIAELAGFSSQSHFTARFRQFVGITPARFRRETCS